jgi:transcription initiation factor TFIIB
VSEAVCPECDVVVTETPVTLRPRPVYGDEDRSRKRAGGGFTLQYPDRGMGVGADGDEWDKPWLHPWTTREYRLGYPLGEIQRMGSRLGLSDAEREHAALLYRKAREQGHVEGRSADGFAAACLLVAVRQSTARRPVSEQELLDISRATRDQFRTARGVLEVKLNEPVPPMRAREFLPAAASSLDTPPSVRHCAETLLSARDDDEAAVESFSPRTLAAAALAVAYDVAGTDSPTLAELSEALNVGTSTISRRKSALQEYRTAWDGSV